MIYVRSSGREVDVAWAAGMSWRGEYLGYPVKMSTVRRLSKRNSNIFRTLLVGAKTRRGESINR